MEQGDNMLYFSDHSQLRVTMAGRLAGRPGWRWEHPGGLDDSLLVWFVCSGAGSIQIDRQALPLRPDLLLFPRLWEILKARQDDAHPLEVLWAFIEVRDLRGRPVNLSAIADQALPPLRCHPRDGAFMRGILERIVLPFTRGAGLNAESDGWLPPLLLETARAQQEAAAPAGPLEAARPAIEAIVRDILADPGRDWRVAQLARRLHCSADHFTRLFRVLTGQTPRRFLVTARISAAKGLLQTSSMTVAAIADALGYSDVCFFSKQFLKETGLPPSRFRRSAGGP